MRERLGLYFLIAVLIPLGLGTLVSERLIERHIHVLAASSAGDRLDVALGRLDDRGRLLGAELMQLGASQPLSRAVAAGDLTAADMLLRGKLQSYPRPDFLWLVTPEGRLAARGAPGATGADVSKVPVVQQALTSGSVAAYDEIDPAWLRRDDPALLARVRARGPAGPEGVAGPATVLVEAAAMPVRDGDRVIGALVGGRVLTGDDATCEKLLDGQREANVIIADRGIVVATSAVPPDGRKRAPTAPPPAPDPGSAPGARLSAAQMKTIARGDRWLGSAGTAGGAAVYSALAPIYNGRHEPIGALGVRMSTARFASLRDDARGSFIMAMGAGAMVALVLSLLAARQITGPLRRLAQAAAAMRKGQFDVKIPVEGRDEVAELALAFKQTAGALSESMSTLESRVVERTLELTQARDREAALNRDLKGQNERLQIQGEQLRAQGDVLEEQRRELEEKTRRSEEADHLKNAFIANMSHEIRTPLNSVLALSQLLRDGVAGPLTNDQRRYLEVIERNGQNLLRLISDILDLSRIEAGHLEMDVRTVDLGPHIRGAVAALLPLAESKGLDVQVKLPDGPLLVRCDVDRVRQVLTNLVGNAIKFTEAGQVQVSAETKGDGAPIVSIHVTDTGVGIPPALTSKIFQEFFQVDQTLARRQGGTGLGLAIASRLAHLMGGDIRVQSVVGSGSRFTVTLPAGTEAEAALVEGGDLGEPLEGRVLLCDPDEIERAATAALLGAAGLEVAAVGSGEEALRALRERTFDGVVIDVDIPGGGGFEVIDQARREPRLARIPFVALVARDLTGSDREALAAPVVGVVRRGESMRASLVSMLGKALKTRGGLRPATPLPPRSASILLVEDNEDNLFTLKQILGGLAVELVSVASGREAIDYCRRRLPDLIIMDMQMPGMSGLQATGAIRALPGGATIPILALTAQAMKGDRERILAAGCDEYLAKPIQPKALLALVERLLGARREELTANGTTLGGPPHRDEKGRHGTHTPRR
jgi:signal transduction histidine kinase/CheY-like chemotaxis protein